MILTDEQYLAHYGILRRSGRYEWGSGQDQQGSGRDFLGYVDGLRKQGLSEADIARGIGVTTTQLRNTKTIALAEKRQSDISMAQRLKDKGNSNVAIAKRMGIPESSVRNLLAPGQADKAQILNSTSDMLRAQVAKKKYIDIGSGVENQLGMSETKLKAAVANLQQEGYKVQYLKVRQLGTGQNTTLKVLTGPDVSYSEVYKNRDHVKQITDFSDDGGRSFNHIKPPTSISSKRVAVRYAKDGGAKADGVIYVRPGVDDISLGASRYAQVRIAVDGTHYLKGMAMYKDDLPPGVDLMFNTNKNDTGNKKDAMKKMGDDPESPFGALISRQHGVMNVVNEEGNWDVWSKSLSSQMLSKQSPKLAREQLGLVQQRKREELEEIKGLTNPAVRKKLLESYADDADSAAVHLKAAALPRQANKVILPVGSLKSNEIYAPSFRNGEQVVLIRHPHGGKFEIPQLTVNNKHPEARRLLGENPIDAVGINSKVAEKLSGADFDGDTVLVIPNNRGKVKTESALEGLKNFDPQSAYPGYPGMPKMSAATKQTQMGVVSNLITDMTIRGATSAELARAVRHSMVVIDAEKHNLDYKRSAQENGIAQLKQKYQSGSKKGGASTIISRAGSELRVPERKQGFAVNPDTGQKVFRETGATFKDQRGNIKPRTTKTTKLAEANDAFKLSSGTPIESVYAAHSNTLKALANEARKTAVNTRGTPYSSSANKAYAKEVASLDAKLNIALKNSPLERQAQVLANAAVAQKKRANPDIDKADLKKLEQNELVRARIRTGAKKQRIEITPEEWNAIQAGAISNSKLSKILSNTDLDGIKKLATPKSKPVMTKSRLAQARAMLANGYTQAEIADALGISVSALKDGLSG